jgi:hypothetical protein
VGLTLAANTAHPGIWHLIHRIVLWLEIELTEEYIVGVGSGSVASNVHLPDLSSFAGVLDILSLGIIMEIEGILCPHKATGFDSIEEIGERQRTLREAQLARKAARKIVHTIERCLHLSLTPTSSQSIYSKIFLPWMMQTFKALEEHLILVKSALLPEVKARIRHCRKHYEAGNEWKLAYNDTYTWDDEAWVIGNTNPPINHPFGTLLCLSFFLLHLTTLFCL